MGTIEEKLSLYTDESLLYLADASSSLHSALAVCDCFSKCSGIRINLDKSVLFPLLPSLPCVDTQTPLQWVDKFTYLGVRVDSTTEAYIEKNVNPLLLPGIPSV